MPVQLTSFYAVTNNETVDIKWETANEINANQFIVERSADAIIFNALGTIAARNNGGIEQKYMITDPHPLIGTSYYRLKQIDKDGVFTYSKIAPVNIFSVGNVILSPNPVGNNIFIQLQSENNIPCTFQVVDMTGKLLISDIIETKKRHQPH